MRANPVAGYAIAVAATLAGIAGIIAFHPTLRGFPFLLPLTVVTLVAYLAGRRPAALAVVLSAPFVQFYLVPPYGTFRLVWPTGFIGMAFYLTLAAMIVSLIHAVLIANTALQHKEAELRQLNDGLEQRVDERTAELVAAQEELRDTNQNLERIVEARIGDLRVANEEIQRFAYIVSHDLRAPLVNVLGFTSELDALRADLAALIDEVGRTAPQLMTPDRRAAIEKDLPEALGFIRASTQKMDRLINAILKLSREGRRKLTPEPIDCAALVTAQGASLSQQLSAHKATLTVEESLPPLVSDRLAVEQIFGNLVENAVKYLARGRPGEIRVSGRAEGALRFYDIEDNGRGIEAKDFERIFELFRRSGEQDTTGEGIGLAYVRNLARRLGGNVTVRSELGRGSTFTVVLPAALKASAGTAAPGPA